MRCDYYEAQRVVVEAAKKYYEATKDLDDYITMDLMKYQIEEIEETRKALDEALHGVEDGN